VAQAAIPPDSVQAMYLPELPQVSFELPFKETMHLTLEQMTKAVGPVLTDLQPALQAHQDDLTKPQGALGRLEEVAVQLGLIQGQLKLNTKKKRIYCFAADHGVAVEGVSAFPAEVTEQMVLNMLGGGAAINQICGATGTELKVVDIGVKAQLPDHDELIKEKVRLGTGNFKVEPAMSVEECEQALSVGFRLAEQAAAEGVSILGTGEMGIANTTTASALFAAYLPCDPSLVVGRGTGVDPAGIDKKAKVIHEGLACHQAALADPFKTLAALGGLEISGLAGLMLGAAAKKICVVVDGFISSAAALAAIKIKPEVQDYLVFSHLSAEQGHQVFAKLYGVRPLLDLGLRLGEGTGAALAMAVIESAACCHNQMATFSGASISQKIAGA